MKIGDKLKIIDWKPELISYTGHIRRGGCTLSNSTLLNNRGYLQAHPFINLIFNGRKNSNLIIVSFCTENESPTYYSIFHKDEVTLAEIVVKQSKVNNKQIEFLQRWLS